MAMAAYATSEIRIQIDTRIQLYTVRDITMSNKDI